MSLTPVFDATLADSAPDIWQASHIFPWPKPEPHISFIKEPHISFIKEKGRWLSEADTARLLNMFRWSWS